jgi:hypothetical protein
MAVAKKQAERARQVAMKARKNPYVQRLMEDQELRDNLAQAYTSARQAMGRLSNGKSPSTQLFENKKLQKDLKKAAESFRDASVALREAPKRRRGGLGFGKLLLLAVIGGAAALALSEGLRKKVLDALFGAEEEFEYTSPTTTATPPAAGEATGTASGEAAGTTS